MSTFLQNAVAFLKSAGQTALTDVEVNAIPAVVSAIGVFQKNPSAAGAAAAEAALLGTVPAALVTAETQFVQTELTAISSVLQGVLARAS